MADETTTPTPPTTPAKPTPPTATEPLDTSALPSAVDDAGDDEFSFLNHEPAAPSAEPAPVSSTPSPAETAAAGAPQQPAPAPAPAAAPAAAAPAAPAPAPAPAAPVPQAPPGAAPKTPDQIAEEYQAHRQSKIEELAAKTFTLDQSTIEALQTEPEKVIPVLMAQATMAAMEATTVAFANMLPEAILRVTKQQRDYEQNETDFYAAWPALKDPKFEATLSQTGALYRQLNPRASKEEFIKAVGATVMASLGLQAPPPPAPAVPAAVRPAPHAPIAVSAPRVGAPAAPSNKFAGLIDDELNGA